MPTAITFTAPNYTGTPSSDDVLAANFAIGLEKKGITQFLPPGTPLPTDGGVNLKASYLLLVTAIITAAHNKYITESKTDTGLFTGFTPSQIEQIKANLLARLNAGESAASIIADTATL